MELLAKDFSNIDFIKSEGEDQPDQVKEIGNYYKVFFYSIEEDLLVLTNYTYIYHEIKKTKIGDFMKRLEKYY